MLNPDAQKIHIGNNTSLTWKLGARWVEEDPIAIGPEAATIDRMGGPNFHRDPDCVNVFGDLRGHFARAGTLTRLRG
jgi:hypothetical protein